VGFEPTVRLAVLASYRIIGCSDKIETSNNIIKKGLAFLRKQSGTVASSGHECVPGSCPAGLNAEVGLRWWRR
jgi:hypothetical protein